MSQNVEGIEEIKGNRRSGEVTDGARDAIMQAALNRANGGDGQDIDMAAAAQGNVGAEVAGVVANGQVEAPQQTQQDQDNKATGLSAGTKITEVDSPERQKATQKMLTGSIDQLALNNLNMLGLNQNKDIQQRAVQQQEMMKAETDKTNVSSNKAQADKDMATVAVGTSAISDTAKKDETSIQTQQVYETGDSAKMQEAKESGLAMGVKIEAPDATNNQTQTEKLLQGSINQMAASNMADLGIGQASGSEGAEA